MQFGAALQLTADHARLSIRLEEQGDLRNEVGHDECVGMLLAAKLTWTVVVQVERAEPDGPYVKRKPEHGPCPCGNGGTAEGGPPWNT